RPSGPTSTRPSPTSTSPAAPPADDLAFADTVCAPGLPGKTDSGPPSGRPLEGGPPSGRPLEGGQPSGRPLEGGLPSGRPLAGAPTARRRSLREQLEADGSSRLSPRARRALLIARTWAIRLSIALLVVT